MQIADPTLQESAMQLRVRAVGLQEAGHLEAALQAYERLVERESDDTMLWFAIADLRLRLELPNAALDACNEALRRDPDGPDALFNAGVVLAALGDFGAALHCYDKVLALQPGHAGALRNRPTVLTLMMRPNDALAGLAQALSAYPKDPWLHHNLGELLLGLRQHEAAFDAYRKALALAPAEHRIRYAYAVGLALVGRVRESQAEMDAALAADPGVAYGYHSPLVMDLIAGSKDLSPARVSALADNHTLRLCDWTHYDQIVRRYARLARGEDGNPPLATPEMPYLALGMPFEEEVRTRVARQTSARIATLVGDAALVRHASVPGTRIRVGYISADFREHPTTWLMGGLLPRHDRSRFEVYAYATDPPLDSVCRRRVAADVDVFREVNRLTPLALAQLIANDGIDILADLSGYTLHTKPEALALRPAPIQVSYLGFMGTSGAPWMDYALLDRNVLLPEIRPYWDEKIAYLPDCSYFCTLPNEVAPIPGRSQLGLAENAFVMCALHIPRKLEPDIFRVWMELLREIPNSVLWLLVEVGEQEDNLRREARAAGVADERLVFSPKCPHGEHLARLGVADVYLDTFHYNGHTTTVDALGMGLPVVTLTGQSVVARVATAMLRAHGLPELAATSVAGYKALVHRMADDTHWRAEMRRKAGDFTHSRLFCPDLRARQIEQAYEIMLQRHRAGLPPADFDVGTES